MQNIGVKLQVQIIKEGNKYIAYAPGFDLSTSGRSMKEAQKRFEEIVHIFIEELTEAGTMEEVLKDLGWQKHQKAWQPPQIVAQENFNLRIPEFA